MTTHPATTVRYESEINDINASLQLNHVQIM
jgi:hypothetical protein